MSQSADAEYRDLPQFSSNNQELSESLSLLESSR